MIHSERRQHQELLLLQARHETEEEELPPPPKKRPATEYPPAVTTRRAAALASFASSSTSTTSKGGDGDSTTAPATAPNPLPTALLHDVQHVRQAHNWDCGLACLLMVLRAVAVTEGHSSSRRRRCSSCSSSNDSRGSAVASSCDLSLAELRNSLGGTTSIWTIDLAHLLVSHARITGGGGKGEKKKDDDDSGSFDGDLVRVTLCTTNAGANPAYALAPFYSRTLRDDAARVASLFESASCKGVAVERRSVSAEELAEKLLSGKFLVVALVDKRKLLVAGEDEEGEGEQGREEEQQQHLLCSPPPRTPPSTPDVSCSPSPASSLSRSTSAQAPAVSTTAIDASRTMETAATATGVVRLSSTDSSTASEDAAAVNAKAADRSSSPPPLSLAAAAAAATPLTPPPPKQQRRSQNHHHHHHGHKHSHHHHSHHLRSTHAHHHHHHGYLGHFVLLCGFDSSSRSFALRDPSDAEPRVRTVPARRLDEARSAFGTDEDLLIVELARPRPASLVSVAFGGGGSVGGGRVAS